MQGIKNIILFLIRAFMPGNLLCSAMDYHRMDIGINLNLTVTISYRN